jgi:hypothetical protein
MLPRCVFRVCQKTSAGWHRRKLQWIVTSNNKRQRRPVRLWHSIVFALEVVCMAATVHSSNSKCVLQRSALLGKLILHKCSSWRSHCRQSAGLLFSPKPQVWHGQGLGAAKLRQSMACFAVDQAGRLVGEGCGHESEGAKVPLEQGSQNRGDQTCLPATAAPQKTTYDRVDRKA